MNARTSLGTLAQLITTMVSLKLEANSSLLFVCDYAAPLASFDFVSSGMPCSGMYVNSTVQSNFKYEFNASFVESINELKVIEGRKCFRLELYTGCEQHWLSANTVKRRFEKREVSRDQCFSGDVCLNCEISSQYPQEDCRVWTFGNLEKSITKTFGTNVPVYQNAIGRVNYGGVNTNDDMFVLGGDYGEKVYFKKVDNKEPVKTKLILNPDSLALISLDMRRLLQFSGQSAEYNSTMWYLYDNNHLVSKIELDAQLTKIKAVRAAENAQARADLIAGKRGF